MPQKYTHKFINQEFEKRNCKLLDIYKNASSPLRYICKCGREAITRWDQFSRGHFCKKCGDEKAGRTKSFSLDYVKLLFKENNCELLSLNYFNSRQKLEYICSCGTRSTITIDSFKRGHRCKNCANKKMRYNFDYVVAVFEKYNCKLLSKEYKNVNEKLKYICSCGEHSEIAFSHFLKGQRCESCRVKSCSGPNHYAWQPDRELFMLKKKLKHKCHSYLKIIFNQTQKRPKSISKKMDELLGYNQETLREHIVNHPNWILVKNKKWNLDHHFPFKAFFDYKIYDTKIINCLENLNPISVKENLLKGGNYKKEEFENWLKSKNINFKSQITVTQNPQVQQPTANF